MSWYQNGLKFKCTGCGKCCTGSPGYVWVSDEEIQEMASFLGITSEEFAQRYTYMLFGRRSLKEHVDKNYDCVFLEDRKCSVYEVRPKQCRTFPFWPENLESAAAWEEVKKRCEGIDHEEAPLILINKDSL